MLTIINQPPPLAPIIYCIVGNFRGVQFSRMANLQNFRGLIFADVRHHAHYTLYNRTYFTGLIFADSRLSAKTAKIGPLENFPLYGSLLWVATMYRKANCYSPGFTCCLRTFRKMNISTLCCSNNSVWGLYIYMCVLWLSTVCLYRI